MLRLYKEEDIYNLDKVKMAPQKSSKSKTTSKGKKAPVPKKTVPKKTVPKKTVPKKTVPKKSSKSIPQKEVQKTKQTTESKVTRTKTTRQKGPRKKVTLESHTLKFDELLDLIDDEIKRKSREKEKGTRTLQRMRKIARELKNETPKIANIKRRRSSKGNRISGFMKKYKINSEGAEFLQVPEGTSLSRRELTNAICVYAHYNPDDKREQMKRWEYLNPGGKRDLQKEGERMIIEPDETLQKLLRYDEYKKDVQEGKIMKTVTEKDSSGEKKSSRVVQDDDSLYYRVIQKLINHLFEKEE